MVPFFGDYNLTENVYIPFNTFSSDDPAASVTITDFAAGDVYIHKNGVEGTPTGITVSLNVGTVNGNHLVTIDLTDTNDAGFYANGARYQVRIEGVTVDGGTLNSWIGAFSIGCTLRPTTSGNTLDVTAGGCAGIDWNNIENKTAAVDLSATDIQLCDTTTNLTNKTGFALASGGLNGVTQASGGVLLANGAVTDASLAGNMEIVFETDFATNYNATRNAWVTNAQDFVGTTAADPFNGQVVAASVTGAVGSVTAGVTLANGAITDASLAGNMEIVFETDFATNYNATRNAWVTNAQDFVGTTAADPFNGQVVAASVTTKTGYSLASDGMDSVVLPADIITAASINTGAFSADAFAANALVAATFAADYLAAIQAEANAACVDVVNVDALVSGQSMAEALRRIGAITSGIISGAGTGTETFKDYAESASTIVVTVDGSGNRSAITYN